MHYFRPDLNIFSTKILLETQYYSAKWNYQSWHVQIAMPKQTAYWAFLHTLVKWSDLCSHELKMDCLTGINKAQRGLKSSLPACGMMHLIQSSINYTSWFGIIHAPYKEYQFTHFQRYHQTVSKMKTRLLNFFHYICGDKYTFAIYIECVKHIDVVLNVNVLAKTHLWSNLLSKVFVTQKEYYVWISLFGSHWHRQKNETQGKSKCRCLGVQTILTLTELPHLEKSYNAYT